MSLSQVSDMCMHFIEKYEMMIVKVLSKWELRRICNAVHATALVRMGAPTPDEMGECALVEVREVGLRKVTVFSQNDDDSRIATIVLRARCVCGYRVCGYRVYGGIRRHCSGSFALLLKRLLGASKFLEPFFALHSFFVEAHLVQARERCTSNRWYSRI